MNDFSWKIFSMTGDVDAYLLYKETKAHNGDEAFSEDETEGEESPDWAQ